MLPKKMFPNPERWQLNLVDHGWRVLSHRTKCKKCTKTGAVTYKHKTDHLYLLYGLCFKCASKKQKRCP